METVEHQTGVWSADGRASAPEPAVTLIRVIERDHDTDGQFPVRVSFDDGGNYDQESGRHASEVSVA